MTEFICNNCGKIFDQDDDPPTNRNNKHKRKRVVCLRCRSRDVEVY